jgi:hypothetical protein
MLERLCEENSLKAEFAVPMWKLFEPEGLGLFCGEDLKELHVTAIPLIRLPYSITLCVQYSMLPPHLRLYSWLFTAK